MASRGKKRKVNLPTNLFEATQKARACIDACGKVMEAFEVLKNAPLPSTLTELNEQQISIWLIAKYGLDSIQRVCTVLSGLPTTLNEFNKQKYLAELTKVNDAKHIDCIISGHCPQLLQVFKTNTPAVLAPPVSRCFECNCQLTSSHDCKVSLYTLSGITCLPKVTLRCQKCSINYNYCMWGRKQSTGFRYYKNQRNLVEVSDTVFFTRELLEFQCSLANHAWVSFQGFMESYNDVFCKEKHQELSARLVSEAFYNGEVEAELRLLAAEGHLSLEECTFYQDSDRESIMERIEHVRSHSIYVHGECTKECKERGCGKLWVTDGIWKLTFPHCMHRVKYIVNQIPALSLPDVCTNSPVPGKAFCKQHCTVLEQHTPPIPTDVRGFLKYCGLSSTVSTEAGIASEDSIQIDGNQERLVEKVLAMTTVSEIGKSAAISQGIDEVLASSPSMMTDAAALDQPHTIMCRKEIGERKRLRRWSRGHQIVVRAGGHIDSWQPLYKSESTSQVFFILLTWLNALLGNGSLDPTSLKDIYIAYDNMCNLCKLKVANKPLPLPPPMDQIWLNVNKIIDAFHLSNHISPICHTKFSPAKMKSEHPHYNTQAGEQTFVWMGRFKNICCAMNKSHHLFYLHRMVRRRNRYTEKCYLYGRKPILPAIKKNWTGSK